MRRILVGLLLGLCWADGALAQDAGAAAAPAAPAAPVVVPGAPVVAVADAGAPAEPAEPAVSPREAALREQVEQLVVKNHLLEAALTAKAPTSTPAPAEPALAALKAAEDVREAVRAPKLLAILAAIASVLWALIAFARRWGAAFWTASRVRLFTIFAGAVAGLLGSVAAGLSWAEAITISLGGPGALALNELLKLFRAAPAAPAPEAPKEQA